MSDFAAYLFEKPAQKPADAKICTECGAVFSEPDAEIATCSVECSFDRRDRLARGMMIRRAVNDSAVSA